MKRPEDDKEFMEVVGHLISHPRFQKLDGIVQHHHSTRLEHSVNVSYTSYKIAKKFGWDAKSTARGGLLHDFFYYDWRVTKFNKSHAWVHPRIAVRNARKLVTMVDKYWAVKEAATPLRKRIKNRKFFRRKTLQSHHQ